MDLSRIHLKRKMVSSVLSELHAWQSGGEIKLPVRLYTQPLICIFLWLLTQDILLVSPSPPASSGRVRKWPPHKSPRSSKFFPPLCKKKYKVFTLRYTLGDIILIVEFENV